MVALRVRNGDVKWRTPATEDFAMQSVGPAHDGERLYTAHETGRFDLYYSFDLETGRVLWKRGLDEEITGVSKFGVIAAQDGIMYAPQHGGTVYGFDGATGQLLRTLDYDIGSVEWVKATEDGLYLGLGHYPDFSPSGLNEGYLIKLRRGSLEEVWRHHIVNGTFIAAPPVIEGDILYTTSGLQGAFAFDTKTGEVLWNNKDEYLDAAYSWVEDGDYLYGAGERIFCVDKRTGRKVWDKDYLSAGGYGIAYLKGRIYHVRGGGIYVLDAKTGEELHFEESPDGYFTWQVTTAGDLLIVQTTSSILAYDVADGR